MDLEEYLISKFSAVIRSWPSELRHDIYALSLYRDDDSVPYRPAVYLVYNTLTHAQSRKPGNLDDNESRWNLALWQHDQWVGIEDQPDGYGKGLDEKGTQDLDIWLRSARQEHGDDVGSLIAAFAALCVRVARRLHEIGVIRESFGRDIPIIMHDDEWSEDMDQNTEKANPPGVAKEFLEAVVF